jgi:hypothetical protein
VSPARAHLAHHVLQRSAGYVDHNQMTMFIYHIFLLYTATEYILSSHMASTIIRYDRVYVYR